jgi:hypothetical protein
MKLASAFNSVIMQVLLARNGAGDSIGLVDSWCKAKEFVTVGTFFERPSAMNCGGELADHSAKESAWTEDKPRAAFFLRPYHPGGNRLSEAI